LFASGTSWDFDIQSTEMHYCRISKKGEMEGGRIPFQSIFTLSRFLQERNNHDEIAEYSHDAALNKVPEICVASTSRTAALHRDCKCLVARNHSANEKQ